MFLEPLPLKLPDVVIEAGGDVAAILLVEAGDAGDLHAHHQEVERDDLEKVLLVLAQKHQADGLARDEESEVALIGIQRAPKRVMSGF